MQGEFLVDRTPVRFDIDMNGLTEPPRTLLITAKKCAMSPALVYDLAYERIDSDRDTAIYRIVGARAINLPFGAG